MKKILIFTIIFFFVSCAGQKIVYVPTEAKTIIEYRDTTIRVVDTIKVEVPREVIRKVMPILDTSRLETSVAYSEAYVDTLERRLHHRLQNKQTTLKSKLDTIVRVEYVNKYIEKEVINEVPVEVPYIPKYAWACIIFTCCWAVLKIAKIIWKFKSGGL